MANIDSVQLPDGSNYNIVDNTSNFATETYVDSAVSGITKTTIGLGNVDNTADLSKPVSTAQQTAINTAVAPKANQTLLAPVESTTTASQTYQIGDQFIYNGLLYKATAVINSGGTITPDGNCELSPTIIAQIGNGTDKGSVSVEANGNKTNATLLTELGALVDFTKISRTSMFVEHRVGTTTYDFSYPLLRYGTNMAQFTSATSAVSVYINSFTVYSNQTGHTESTVINSSSISNASGDTSKPTSGSKYTIYY